MNVSRLKSWQSLKEHADSDLSKLKIWELLESDDRHQKLVFEFDQLTVDFTKQKLNSKTLQLLLKLAEEADLESKIAQLFSGEKVNTTEKRAALHTALRLPAESELVYNNENINSDIQKELARMSLFVERITSGAWRGFSGKPITDIVNLGVGGSDLGPLLVCDALDEFKQNYKNPIKIHFASTMDGSQVSSLFETLNPETTLFVIVSKSFTTIDTLSNANSAKEWLLNSYNNEKIINSQHFIGISAAKDKMEEWGIPEKHQLRLWDWVGGRFSLWSSVGLTIALKLGMDNFRAFLDGAHALDVHFQNSDPAKNLPIIFGLIGILNTNFLGINTQAILPYDARLKYFPSYLTQLEMESNGKSVTHLGANVDFNTCPVLWGEVGPNGQHAFYQLLHQGTRKVVCDFIAPISRFTKSELKHKKALFEQHLLTLANCFAQSRALMVGSNSGGSDSESCVLSKHRHYPGDQPSTTILMNELSAYSLGQLIALYEHKVFVMAAIWDINPFDQWGVELGKVMAKDTYDSLLNGSDVCQFDSSTNFLMNLVKKQLGERNET